MSFNNEHTVFDIPSLSDEWVLNAILYHDKSDNNLHLSDKLNGFFLCSTTIFHTIIGDIHKFSIVCRYDYNHVYVYEWILVPILTEYCKKNNIELKFEYV